MNNRSMLLIFTLGVSIFITATFSDSYAQTIQDLSCSGCVQIKNSDQLKIHDIINLPIVLWADDFIYTYDHSSKITINGHSKLNNPDVPIIFTVTNPIGNVVTVKQMMVPQNSDFKVEFNPTGPLWKADGMYIIKAQAGPQSTVFKTNVRLLSMDSQSRLECNSNEITVLGDQGGQYCFPFESTFPLSQISGNLNTGTKTLTLNLQSNFAHAFSIDVDKRILNAKSPTGDDADFVVMVNGKSYDYTENESFLPGYRTITLSFGAGSNTVEIVGTSVIPEFGSIAVFILVVAIISIIALSSKKIPLANTFSRY